MNNPDQERWRHGNNSAVVEAGVHDQVIIDQTQLAIAEGLSRLRQGGVTAQQLTTLDDMLGTWESGEPLIIKNNRKKPARGRMLLTVNLAQADEELPVEGETPQDQLSFHINTSPPSGKAKGAIPTDAILVVSTVGVSMDKETRRPKFETRAGIRFEKGNLEVDTVLYTAGGVTAENERVNSTPLSRVSTSDYATIFRRVWSFSSRNVRHSRA